MLPSRKKTCASPIRDCHIYFCSSRRYTWRKSLLFVAFCPTWCTSCFWLGHLALPKKPRVNKVSRHNFRGTVPLRFAPLALHPKNCSGRTHSHPFCTEKYSASLRYFSIQKWLHATFLRARRALGLQAFQLRFGYASVLVKSPPA